MTLYIVKQHTPMIYCFFVFIENNICNLFFNLKFVLHETTSMFNIICLCFCGWVYKSCYMHFTSHSVYRIMIESTPKKTETV